MLKISETADRLSLSVPTVRTIPAYQLPVSFTPGGQRRYREEDVEKYLATTTRRFYDVSKTFAWGLAQQFVERIKGERLGVVKAVLFGSYARGDFNPNSDIDVFVVVRNRIFDITSKIVDASGEGDSETAHLVTPFIMSESEFDMYRGEPVCQAIEKDGVVLWQR